MASDRGYSERYGDRYPAQVAEAVARADTDELVDSVYPVAKTDPVPAFLRPAPTAA